MVPSDQRTGLQLFRPGMNASAERTRPWLATPIVRTLLAERLPAMDPASFTLPTYHLFVFAFQHVSSWRGRCTRLPACLPVRGWQRRMGGAVVSSEAQQPLMLPCHPPPPCNPLQVNLFDGKLEPLSLPDQKAPVMLMQGLDLAGAMAGHSCKHTGGGEGSHRRVGLLLKAGEGGRSLLAAPAGALLRPTCKPTCMPTSPPPSHAPSRPYHPANPLPHPCCHMHALAPAVDAAQPLPRPFCQMHAHTERAAMPSTPLHPTPPHAAPQAWT